MDLNEYFKGYCVIRIEAASVRDFVNQALAAGIPLLDICQIEANVWQGKTAVASLQRLRVVAHRTEVYFRVTENKGLFATARRVKKRWYSLAVMAAVLFFLALYSESALAVRVDTDDPLPREVREEILSLAADYGVCPGLFCDESRWEEGAKAILATHEDLSWVGFQKNGVVLTVKVIVKEEAKDKTVGYGHVVAKKDGVVRKIFVLRGEKLAVPDAPVKKGDILISGNVTYYNNDGEASGATAAVHADGIVEGSAWYSAEVTEACKVLKKQATGAYANGFYWLGSKNTLLLWGSGENPFLDSTAEAKTISCFGVPLFSAEIVAEVVPKTISRSIAETEAAAYAKATAEAKKKISKTAEIIEVKKEILARSPGSVSVRVTVETYENLGCFQSFDKDFEKAIE